MSVATILSSCPYSSQPLIVQGQLWRLPSPHQIFVWVSITQTAIDREEFPSNAHAFPALLDTGCSSEFLLSEEQLAFCNQTERNEFPYMRDRTVNGIPVPFHEADIWIHCNQPGHRDLFLPDEKPFPLRIKPGVGIYRPNSPASKQVPLLGLKALNHARTLLLVDTENRVISIHGDELP
jgi:hypothetical protein